MVPPTKKIKLMREVELNDDESDKGIDVLDLPTNHTVHLALKLSETLGSIFRHLSVADRGRAAQVCENWRDGVDQPSVWYDYKFTICQCRPIPFASLRRRRIRKFVIEYFSSPFLFYYTLKSLFCRVPDVQSLQFYDCDLLTDSILHSTLPRLGLPHMTDLHLGYCNFITDVCLELITRLMPNLVTFNLEDCELITDNSLLLIALRLRQLKILDMIDCCLVTDRGFGYLAGKINLQDVANLNLDLDLVKPGLGSSIVRLRITCFDQLTNKTLLHLSGMTELRQLEVVCCKKITNTGLVHLEKMANLQKLELNGCRKVNDTGLAYLAKMAKLQELELTDSPRVSDAGLACLAEMANLTGLRLCGCQHVSDNGLANLTKMAKLNMLDLSDCCRVSDAGLEHVAKMHGLEQLMLSGCHNITLMGIRNLARNRPQLILLDVTFCDRIASDALLVIAEGLLYMRWLYLDHDHVTPDGLQLAAANLLDLEVFEVSEQDAIKKIVALRQQICGN